MAFIMVIQALGQQLRRMPVLIIFILLKVAFIEHLVCTSIVLYISHVLAHSINPYELHIITPTI